MSIPTSPTSGKTPRIVSTTSINLIEARRASTSTEISPTSSVNSIPSSPHSKSFKLNSISPTLSDSSPSPFRSTNIPSYNAPYPPFPESRIRRESAPLPHKSLMSPSTFSSAGVPRFNGFSMARGSLFDQIVEDEVLELNGNSQEIDQARRSSSFIPRTAYSPDPAASTDSFAAAQREKSPRKKRPSDIMTGTSSINKALESPFNSLQSPRFRRQYPMDMNSPLSSPAGSAFSLSIDSSSSSSGGYLTPNSNSPSSLSSPSPIFSTLSSIAKSSASSIRRASTTLALVTPSPTRSGSIVAEFVSSLASPMSGVTRRGSYAFQAREKAKEKEVEVESEKAKLSVSQKGHARLFSFAGPDERLNKKERKSLKGKMGWKSNAFASLAMVGLISLIFYLRSGRFSSNSLEAFERGDRARGGENTGTSFIHPQVIQRTAPTSFLSSSWRRLRNTLAINRRGSKYKLISSTLADWKQIVWFIGRPKARSRHTYRVASHTTFSQNHPLPPPPVHDDAPERDTLILYRILGNDLPPRHSPGQTLRNLRFLLQHESDFSSLPHLGPHSVHHSHLYGSGSGARKSHSEDGGLLVDKYFVLNRIAEPEMVGAILGLLRLYAVPESRILIIPFDWNEYQRRDFRWDGGVDKVVGWGISINEDEMLSDVLQAQVEANGGVMEKSKRVESLRLRALDFMYHEKTLYAMNNNGGRNFALQHGKTLRHARWILPLDGNSFVTPAAMNSIVRTLSISGEGTSASRYVVMPMARLLDNEAVLSNNSITLVPKYVQELTGDSETASEEAVAFHHPPTAPFAPEEPQIGFRYDSTEVYQEAMRYGRRSKLEFLWRLGVVPYSRALDKKTLPWESSDRAHISVQTWGSIPGAAGTNSTSIVHSPYGDGSSILNPERGPLAFSKAGWIYRLFSGETEQERISPAAVSLRAESRIKGIVNFLEQLDAKVARGQEGCQEEVGTTEAGHCGFSSDRLWSFNLEDVEHLRRSALNGTEDSVRKVRRFEKAIAPVEFSVLEHLANPSQIHVTDIQAAATNISLLAMAGFLSGNSNYTFLASQLVTMRFVQQTPIIYRHEERYNQVRAHRSDDELTAEEDGLGYSFPPPPNMNGPGYMSAYDSALGASSHLPELPFSPLDFDPTLILDAIRLLTHPGSPEIDHHAVIHRMTVYPVFSAQLSYLLFSKSAISLCRNPPSITAGAQYDAKLAVLAAFLDDARLFGRVANRSRLRLKESMRIKGIIGDAGKVFTGLVKGIRNTKFRPYSLELERENVESYAGRSGIYGSDSSFGLLGI